MKQRELGTVAVYMTLQLSILLISGHMSFSAAKSSYSGGKYTSTAVCSAGRCSPFRSCFNGSNYAECKEWLCNYYTGNGCIQPGLCNNNCSEYFNRMGDCLLNSSDGNCTRDVCHANYRYGILLLITSWTCGNPQLVEFVVSPSFSLLLPSLSPF